MIESQPGRDRPGPAAAGPAKRPELLRRAVSALVMAALALATAWVGGPVFDVFWCLAATAVLWEWHGLVGLKRRNPAVILGGTALAAAALLAARGEPGRACCALILGAAVTIMLADRGRRGIAAAGPLYAGAIALAVPLLRQSAVDGFAVLAWLFAVVWGTDTMAFFGGRAIGGPRLAPHLSPSKTWSGFAVGVLSGAVLGLLVSPRSGCAVCVFAAGLVGGGVAQLGDLFESALKRRFGAKDAGSIIPGHGGLMDRLDGFIATSALAAVVGVWRFGPEAAGAGLLRW